MKRGLIVTLIALVCLGGAVQAQPYAYEGFDYPLTSLLRLKNGGTGWSGSYSRSTWNDPANADFGITNGLTYTNLSTSPGAITSASPYVLDFRNLSQHYGLSGGSVF